MLEASLVLLLAAPLAAAEPSRIELVTPSGERHGFTVEWARSPADHQRGLMFRETLPPDHGMLFDFQPPRHVSFWMRNTPLPLDMIFIGPDTVVRNVHARAEPFSDASIPSGAVVRWVLEVAGGTAERLGIAPGARLVLEPEG